jgi:hypothetical protein
MKVRIENYGGLLIVRNGKIRFEIPARCVGDKAVVVTLPDDDVAQRVLSNLTRRHRALHVALVDESGGLPAPLPEAPEEPKEVVDELPGEGVTEDHEPELLEAVAGKMTLDDFKAMVKAVTKGSAGWWTVEIEGREPLKVRGATSEEDATEKAFEEYLEGVE